jgi:hypothetical protein
VGGMLDAARWVAFYTGKTLADTLRLQRPRPGVLFYFIKGALGTFRYRLDKRRGVFVQR